MVSGKLQHSYTKIFTAYQINGFGDVGSAKYDAFGNIVSGTQTAKFGYRGQYHDSETGSIYLRARYYRPGIGRFMTEDPARDGLNWYTYCGNNPVRYIDPSGYVIELSSNATKEETLEYERAIEYLKTSEDGKALIEKLENSNAVFTIIFRNGDDQYDNENAAIIYWDFNSGLILGDGKSIQSPALALIHEMGHASQDLDGLFSLMSLDEYEADNLKNYETPIALELGEYTRKDYLDTSGVYTMRNSTDWGTKNSHAWHWYIWPGNWFTKYDYTNLNPWTP